MNKRQAKKKFKKDFQKGIKALGTIDWGEVVSNITDAVKKIAEVVNKLPDEIQKKLQELKENANEEEQET